MARSLARPTPRGGKSYHGEHIHSTPSVKGRGSGSRSSSGGGVVRGGDPLPIICGRRHGRGGGNVTVHTPPHTLRVTPTTTTTTSTSGRGVTKERRGNTPTTTSTSTSTNTTKGGILLLHPCLPCHPLPLSHDRHPLRSEGSTVQLGLLTLLIHVPVPPSGACAVVLFTPTPTTITRPSIRVPRVRRPRAGKVE